MVQNETQETVEEREIDLLVDLRQNRLHHDIAFAFARLPDICEVIDTLTPLIHKEWRGFSVGRLDPGREEATLISLEEQELIEVLKGKTLAPIVECNWHVIYGVGDLLHGLNVIARNELVVGVEELDARLLERTLCE